MIAKSNPSRGGDPLSVGKLGDAPRLASEDAADGAGRGGGSGAGIATTSAAVLGKSSAAAAAAIALAISPAAGATPGAPTRAPCCSCAASAMAGSNAASCCAAACELSDWPMPVGDDAPVDVPVVGVFVPVPAGVFVPVPAGVRAGVRAPVPAGVPGTVMGGVGAAVFGGGGGSDAEATPTVATPFAEAARAAPTASAMVARDGGDGGRGDCGTGGAGVSRRRWKATWSASFSHRACSVRNSCICRQDCGEHVHPAAWPAAACAVGAGGRQSSRSNMSCKTERKPSSTSCGARERREDGGESGAHA